MAQIVSPPPRTSSDMAHTPLSGAGGSAGGFTQPLAQPSSTWRKPGVALVPQEIQTAGNTRSLPTVPAPVLPQPPYTPPTYNMAPMKTTPTPVGRGRVPTLMPLHNTMAPHDTANPTALPPLELPSQSAMMGLAHQFGQSITSWWARV
jgi:hypothetical protein